MASARTQPAPQRRYTALSKRAFDDGNDPSWAALGARVERNRFGEYLVTRQWYASPDSGGCDTNATCLLLRPTGRCPRGQPLHARHVRDAEKWLFLDTEATGFIGGAGTIAFLIGLAWWDSGGIQIEQLFMREPNEEYAVLYELATRIRKRPVLVTFNGKSFDWPLLASRFQMSRRVSPPELDAHLDFLHPAREIWKLQIGRVKLGNLEEHVLGSESLGWSRREDIHSGLIPGIYFDFLRGVASNALESVFRHNRMDLRGLAALSNRILRMVSADESAIAQREFRALESYGVARFLGRRGEHRRARLLCEAALESGLPAALELQARAELAKFAKCELRALQALRSAEAGHAGARRSMPM
jgi:uncharacterized protein YprB with RNaseH-like and TPR domain